MTAVSVILIAAAAGAIGFALYAAIGMSEPRQSEALSRLARIQPTGGGDLIAGSREEQLAIPFTKRFLGPLLDRVGSRLSASQSRSQIDDIEAKLLLAGNPGNLTAPGFLALQIVSAVGGVVLGIVLVNFLGLDLASGAIVILALGLAGFILPRTWLSRRIAERREEILVALPNALDLLTISVEAGLGFDPALQRVAEKYQNSLSEELNKVLAEIRLGRPRRESLTAMADRLEVDELTNFIVAVVQSEQLGTGLAQTLRIQSEEMRRRWRQRAEEKGAKAPLKMLLPMVGCIFPTLFVVLLGPAALQVFRQFSGGGP